LNNQSRLSHVRKVVGRTTKMRQSFNKASLNINNYLLNQKHLMMQPHRIPTTSMSTMPNTSIEKIEHMNSDSSQADVRRLVQTSRLPVKQRRAAASSATFQGSLMSTTTKGAKGAYEYLRTSGEKQLAVKQQVNLKYNELLRRFKAENGRATGRGQSVGAEAQPSPRLVLVRQDGGSEMNEEALAEMAGGSDDPAMSQQLSGPPKRVKVVLKKFGNSHGGTATNYRSRSLDNLREPSAERQRSGGQPLRHQSNEQPEHSAASRIIDRRIATAPEAPRTVNPMLFQQQMPKPVLSQFAHIRSLNRSTNRRG